MRPTPFGPVVGLNFANSCLHCTSELTEIHLCGLIVKIMKTLKVLSLASVLLPCVASAAVVSNGDFSTGGLLRNIPDLYDPDTTGAAPPGWSFVEDGYYGAVGVWDPAAPPVTVGLSPYTDPWAAPTLSPSAGGGQFAVLYNGYLSQEITNFLPNTQYQLQFEYAGLFVGGTGVNARNAVNVDLRVQLSGIVSNTLSIPVDYPDPPPANDVSILGPWSTTTFTFTTDSTVTLSSILRLEFKVPLLGDYYVNPDKTTVANHGAEIALDSVSITAVPEASTAWCLLIVGGLAAAYRRRAPQGA